MQTFARKYRLAAPGSLRIGHTVSVNDYRTPVVDKNVCVYRRKAPAKRSQHINTTYRKIVGPTFASSGQTIATFRYNISRHCWAQQVAQV